MFLRRIKIVGNHFRDHLAQRDFRFPAQFFMCFGRIAQQRFHLSRTEVARVNGNHDIAWLHARRIMSGHRNHDAFFIHALTFKAQFNPQLSGRHFHELAHGILHAGGNDEIFRLILLQHHPLHPDVIFGMPPVAQ